jgi:hypothetical protein
MNNKVKIFLLSFALFSFCFILPSTYSIEKPKMPTHPLTDWAVLTVKSVNYDLNIGKFYLNSSEPFNITYKVNSGTPNFSIEIKDNLTVIYSQSFGASQGLIQNIPLLTGANHSIKLKIEDASGQSKESDFDMDIR